MARLLRTYHDAVAGWQTDTALVWADGSTGTGGESTLVCHGDFGPWNMVWQGTRPVCILDWECAHVAPELVRQLAAQGHQRQVAMVEAGELDGIHRWIRWCEEHRSLFE